MGKIKWSYLVQRFTRSTCSSTEYSNHHVIPDHLDGATGDEEKGVQDISVMNQGVSGRSVHRFEPHGQRPQAGLAAPVEGLAVLEQ